MDKRRHIKKLCLKSQSGQSMVEFALTLPLLILILCAIVDFGWLFSNQLLVDYCAREGARFGTINATQTNAQSVIQTHVLDVAPGFMTSGGAMTVNVSFTGGSDVESGDVIVSVVYNCPTLTPLSGIFTGSQTVGEVGKCQMKVE